ncbi:MAG: hypothetical protein INQ03_21665 [Candidatus Heimdallarchaeota archaeon]|nr:hypothetical protein [Candidatus Heimdallarchaeota archaeon]
MKFELQSEKVLFVLVFFHLLISLINYEFYDWIVEWMAAVRIAQGEDMYELAMIRVNGARYYRPHHFPLFFYALALVIKVFGAYQWIGRIFLWLCVLILTYVTSYAVDENDKVKWSNLFLLSPILLVVEYPGKFDQFVMMFLLAGVIIGIKGGKYSLVGGILLGLGVMSKIIPIIALGVLGYSMLRNKKFQDAVLLLFGSIIGIAPIFLYFYNKHGDKFIYDTIIVQVNRNDISSSMWSYFLTASMKEHFHYYQIPLLLVSLIFVLFVHKKHTRENILLATSGLITSYLLVTRIIYPHYIFWLYSTGYVFFARRFTEKRKNFYIWQLLLLIAMIGGMIWVKAFDYRFYFLEATGVFIQYLAFIIYLVWISYIYWRHNQTSLNSISS